MLAAEGGVARREGRGEVGRMEEGGEKRWAAVASAAVGPMGEAEERDLANGSIGGSCYCCYYFSSIFFQVLRLIGRKSI